MKEKENLNEEINEEQELAEDQQEDKVDYEKKIKELEALNAETFDKIKRMAAEFDNYRKRTSKEKEEIYKKATIDVIESFLPVIDSVELANANVHKDVSKDDIIKGMELVYRQFKEVLSKIGVEEIEGKGTKFDPELHNAVMHEEDENYGENEVIEELQKGYTYKDKVIRYSMVKVAN